MKRMRYCLLALLLICTTSQAQDAAKSNLFSLEDCVINRDLYPESLSQLQWRGDSDQYTYVNKAGNTLLQGSVDGDKKILLELATINDWFPEETTALNRFPRIKWRSSSSFSFIHDGTLWACNVDTKSVEKHGQVEEGAENLEISKQLNLAFTKGGNLYVFNDKNERTLQITTDGNHDIVYGAAAHRYEFGIQKGIFWSPLGDAVAFYRIDQSMVTDYPLINYNEIPAELKQIKYPMAGARSQEVEVHVYWPKTEKTVILNTEMNVSELMKEPDHYLTNITWSPDGKFLFVAELNREQNFMQLNLYDAQKGKQLKTLFTESNEKYVEPEHGPYFLEDESGRFLWFSERDGFDHLYLYDMEGNLIRQVTKGNWEVTQVHGFSPDRSEVIITSTKESPLERQGYAVNLESGQMRRLTKGSGTHNLSLSHSGKYLIDNFSSLETPRKIRILDIKDSSEKFQLLEADNPLLEYEMGEMEVFSLPANDGTDLYCRLIKPADFDPSKQYPCIVYVYGGPHVQLITNRWMGGAQLFLNYLAQQGYVVLTVENRGSSHRGLEFEQKTFRKLGEKEIEDQLTGISFLKKQSYVDPGRIGIYGWSFGGYMTVSMMLKHPDECKVAVAGGPVINWDLYEVMYTERYMDTPETNSEGFDNTDLTQYVEQLKGKLMIIHGLQDDVVVPQHTRSFVRKCVEKGVVIDYFPYPSHPHNVRGRDRVHLLKTIHQYFEEHL